MTMEKVFVNAADIILVQ